MNLGCVRSILLSVALCPLARAGHDVLAGAAAPTPAPATRISPVPAGAPEWPMWRPGPGPSPGPGPGQGAVRRSDALQEAELAPDVDGPRAPGPSARRLRDALHHHHRHAAHDREVVGADFPAPPPPPPSLYARPASAGFSHRDDEPPTAYSWDDDDGHAPPPTGDIVLDVALPHKGDEDQGKTARGPVVVRGPPFNSVAIGFLVYLILLTVLQSSIMNITTKQGLLGALRPARAVAERRAGTTDLLQDTLDPVLVAAILDSDQPTLGGPRRGRGWRGLRAPH